MQTINLHGTLKFWATRWPDRLAVRCGGRDISWGALDRNSDEIAAGLVRAGVCKGDRVGILMRNRLEFIEVLFGVLKAGAVHTLINIRFTAKELVYPIVDSGLKILITQPDFLETLSQARYEVPDLELFTTEPSGPVRGLAELRIPGAGAPDVSVTADDVALVSYTSGTTGFPKGAMLTHGNLREAGMAISVPLGLTFQDRLLVSLPLAYTWGTCVYLIEALFTGATTIVDTVFAADSLIDLFERERISAWSSVPLLFERVAQSPLFATADLSSLRNVSTGAASRHLLNAWQSRGVMITQGYGLTESTGYASFLFSEDAIRKMGSAGRPLANIRMRIVDESGLTVPSNSPGEIWIQGPTVMKGYLNKPEETANAVVDGWLKSGDIGYFDDEGYLFVIDRVKDIVRSGGMNISTAELERVLDGVAGLEEFAVISVHDERWGEVPMIVAHVTTPLDIQGLIARSKADLADYKRPKYLVDYCKPLPRTISGKVLKRDLRSEYPHAPPEAIHIKD
jgi:fatty-acyl-CoA synthase